MARRSRRNGGIFRPAPRPFCGATGGGARRRCPLIPHHALARLGAALQPCRAAAAIALVLAANVVALPAAAQGVEAPLAGFDAYVSRAVKDWDVPGLAVAVVKDDSMVFAR